MEDDLDTIRLKELDELTDSDKKILKEKEAELSDEEKEVFKEVLEVKKVEKPKVEEEEETELPKTKEELNKYIEETISEREEKKRQEQEEEEKRKKEEEEAKARGEEIPEFFKPDYVAKNWNEAFIKALPAIEKYIFGKSAKLTQEQRDKIAGVEKEFDQQLVDIRKASPDLPAIDTPEGKKFEEELDNIVVKFKGVTDMNEAFEIYQATHTKEEETKDKSKSLARKIGGGGAPKETPQTMKYPDLHRKSMDEIIEDEIGEEV